MRAAVQVIASDNTRVVIGLGVTGLSCARYFAARGQRFRVADSRLQPPGLDQFRREFPEVDLQLGPFELDQFDGVDELIVSPGVSLQEPALAAAISGGAQALGDIELFCREARAPLAAITGSNGKSTVTTLLGNMARRAGRKVAVGGNLGTPALDLLSEEVELYVLELSSFQLERCSQVNAEVATVLNISEDHIDRHGNLIAYHQAKHRIFRGCRQVVINRDDPLTQPLVPETVRRWSFGLGAPGLGEFGILEVDGEPHLAFDRDVLMPLADLHIAGRHNAANALAALALGHALGLPMPVMLEELHEFAGLRHRCQYVGSVDGVRFYDDSKGTNVGAAVAAIRGLAVDRNLVLIAGGQGKGADFAPLAECLAECAKGVVLIGESAPVIAELLDERVASRRCDSLESAVSTAKEMAVAGDVVLLSPACASFDMFDNYQHRGDVFQQSVHALLSGGGA